MFAGVLITYPGRKLSRSITQGILSEGIFPSSPQPPASHCVGMLTFSSAGLRGAKIHSKAIQNKIGVPFTKRGIAKVI